MSRPDPGDVRAESRAYPLPSARLRRAVTLAAELEREAGEWLALRATAERDAEDARRNAEARQRAAEETALAVLRSLAVAA